MRLLITSMITDFFWSLNWIANLDVSFSHFFKRVSSSIILVGKCPNAITHKAITVRKAATSFATPRGASADNDLSTLKSCFCTVSSSTESSTLNPANKRPSTISEPPMLTYRENRESEIDWRKKGHKLLALQFGLPFNCLAAQGATGSM